MVLDTWNGHTSFIKSEKKPEGDYMHGNRSWSKSIASDVPDFRLSVPEGYLDWMLIKFK